MGQLPRYEGLLILICFLTTASAFAETGGPDHAGYVWADSFEENISYEWIEIPAASRNPLDLGDDDMAGPIDLPFEFVFYGSHYSAFYVGSNGSIAFRLIDMSTGFSGQCPLPDPDEPNLSIYGFYQDLNPTEPTSEAVYYGLMGEPGSRTLVVTFEQIDLFLNDWSSDPVTFQMVLTEGDERIRVNVMESGELAGGPRWSDDTTIGIENENGTHGVGLCPGTGGIPDGYSVHFFRTDGPGIFPHQQETVAQPGTELQLNYSIRNFGDEPQTFLTTPTSSLGWTVTSNPSNVAIPTGESRDVQIEVRVPPDAAVAISDRVTVRVVAGQNEAQSSALIRLNHPSDAWQTIAPLPQPLAHGHLVATDGRLFFMGGEYSDPENSLPTPVASTWSWSPEENIWRDEGMADLPAPVTRGASCAMSGRIYFLGGLDGPAPHGEHWSFQPELWIYDSILDVWSRAAPPAHGLALAGMACRPGKVYVVGGWSDVDGDGILIKKPEGEDTTLALLWIYDTNENEWSSATPPEFSPAAAAFTGVGDEFILAGGILDDPSEPDSMWMLRYTSIYDPDTDHWSEGGILPDDMTYFADAAYKGQLCIVGGDGNGGALNGWLCYGDGAWIEQLDHINVARKAPAAAVLGEHIYLAGGYDADAVATEQAERWPTAQLPDPSEEDGGIDAGLDADAGTDTDGGVDAGVDAGTDAGADSGSNDGGDSGSGDGADAGPASDAGDAGDIDDGGQGDPGSSDEFDGDGCGCMQAVPAAPAISLWLVFLLPLARRRSRRV